MVEDFQWRLQMEVVDVVGKSPAARFCQVDKLVLRGIPKEKYSQSATVTLHIGLSRNSFAVKPNGNRTNNTTT